VKWIAKGLVKVLIVGALMVWALTSVLGTHLGLRTSNATIRGFMGGLGGFIGLAPSGGDAFRNGQTAAQAMVAAKHAPRASTAPKASTAPPKHKVGPLVPMTTKKGQKVQ
jgi:hypothetical protein